MAIDTAQKRFSFVGFGNPIPQSVTVPSGTVDGPARADLLYLYSGISLEAPAATCAVSGTIIGATEADIVVGGRTILLTLTNDTWVAAGATFNDQRQNIIDGLDSAQSETTGWNAEVRDKEVVGAVVRTSDTLVTITLTASALYDITATETITVTVPASALVTSGDAVVATPTFNVAFVELRTGGGKGAKKYRGGKRKYPRRIMVDGTLYTVRSAEEERQLLQALLDRRREEVQKAEAADQPVPAKKRAVIRRIEARIEKVEPEADEWMDYLRRLDADIIVLLSG